MSPVTHCLPNGALGTGELPVPNISSATISTFNPPGGAGTRRGVIVYLHGLYASPVAVPVPYLMTDATVSITSLMNYSLVQNLINDGWVVLSVPYAEDPYIGVPAIGIYNDVNNDSTDGARYLASTLHGWDHVVTYIQNTYGSNFPIGLFGFSEGGWKALAIAANRASTLSFFMAHASLTVWSSIGTNYTIAGYNYQTLNTSGMDISATGLSPIPTTLKGMVGYSTADTAVWYGGNSTVATINSGTSPIAVASVTGFTVSGGSTNFNSVSGLGTVTLTGLSGGSGRATFTYTGYSAGAFSGLTLISGSGSVTTSSVAVQSTTDSMLTAYYNVGANTNITRMSTGAEQHTLSTSSVGTYVASGGPYSLTTSSSTTITTGLISYTNSGSGLISGSCSIRDGSGTWHPITFSSATGGGTSIVGVDLVSGTATIPNGAPICNTGTSITGGYSNLSYLYWLNGPGMSGIDAAYPATL